MKLSQICKTKISQVTESISDNNKEIVDTLRLLAKGTDEFHTLAVIVANQSNLARTESIFLTHTIIIDLYDLGLFGTKWNSLICNWKQLMIDDPKHSPYTLDRLQTHILTLNGDNLDILRMRMTYNKIIKLARKYLKRARV